MASIIQRLLAAGAVAFVCFAAPASYADDDGVGRWRQFIAAASRTFAIPESWILSVMRAESAGQQTLGGKPITSSAGAMGLMQIMPHTWEELHSRYGLGSDPYDPHDNIFAGAAYLRELYQRYGYPNLFAAYNAGPGRLDAYLGRGQGLPDETEAYLVKLGVWPETVPPGRQRLFFDLTQRGLNSAASEPGRLFIALSTAPASQ